MIRIAIDGPGGAGKSTIAKIIASRLEIEYIDTGAMYRAVGYKLAAAGVDMNDEKALKAMLDDTVIDFRKGAIYLDGKDISGKIRTEEVSKMASACSALAPVREKLVEQQRGMAGLKSVIMDGRDIGTNVLTDAELKIFLTASAEERAQRRYDELIAKGEEAVYEDVLKDINERDYNDTHRKLNPLVKADDAVELDTTHMSIEEVVEYILQKVRDKMAVYDWEKFGLHIPQMMMPKDGTDYSKWACVACDQFTSEPEYWEEVEKIVGDAPSTLRLMLPELYLDKPGEAEKIVSIRETMKQYLEDGTLQEMAPGAMLIKRTAEGRTRLGLVIATDLEAYDFNKGSKSLTRATEGTVIERIPPRLRIREGAPIELPHIMILIDDPEKSVIEPLVNAEKTLIYDTDLMMDGGHITGEFIAEEALEGAKEALSVLYDKAEEKYGEGNVIFQAMGDGNHSLATAKTMWENLKKTLSPEEIETHPARYALCEIENIHDEGIVFEPIHRVIFAKEGQSGMGLVERLLELLNEQNGKAYLAEEGAKVAEGAFTVPYITKDQKGIIVIEEPSNKLEVGALQNALDVMVKEEKSCDIDYIHGTAAVNKLSTQEGNAGFMLPPMDKFMLFPAVAADGALPRKTFSMGEANEKRYYIESRQIFK